jgi:putative addiction module CopG family antidote
MAHALTKANEVFLRRMVRSGRFINRGEVVREALRRMEKEEMSYLNPPPLTPAQAEEIYGPNSEEEARERAVGRAASRSVRRAAKTGTRP